MNQKSKMYIRQSEFTRMAMHDARIILSMSKMRNLKARVYNKMNQEQGIKASTVVPPVKSWSKCLSEAMKRMYREYIGVGQITQEMLDHNARLLEAREADKAEAEKQMSFYASLGKFTND